MRGRLVALAAAALLLLAACTAADDGADRRTEAPSDGAPDPLADVNPVPREDLADGGNLRIGVALLPEQWNPAHVAGADPAFARIREATGVSNFDHDGSAVPEPNENFLESVDEKVDGDRHVVTLHLNPDAVWNSGEPITWEDYAAFVDACDGSDPEILCGLVDPFSRVESVERGESDFDVVVTFATVYPDWRAALGTVLPAEGVADAATFNEGWLEPPADWMTGPYAVEDADTDGGRLTLVPNERWWGPEPVLDEVTFRTVSAEAGATAFSNGELDVLDIGPDPNAYAIARTVEGAEVRRALAPSWRQLTFNTTTGPLNESRVRHAVARALDRSVIAASDLAGLPEELATPLGNHIFVRGQEGYEDNGKQFAHDPEQAAADLEAAGWVLDDATGVRTKDGEPLRLRMTVFTGVPASENEGRLVQDQLREIGIEVETVPAAEQDFGEILMSGDFGIIGFSWFGGPYPLAAVEAIYGNPETSPRNVSGLGSHELDGLLAELASETDPEERLELADEADELIWELMPNLPLYQRPELVAVDADVANLGAQGFTTTRPESWGFAGEDRLAPPRTVQLDLT